MKQYKFEKIGFFSDVLSAEFLSNTMIADWDKGGRNLNKISHDSAINLILKVKNQVGFKVKTVYLDTVGDPLKYKEIIEKSINDESV
jgi:hypothetical protein